jgi:adenylate cyclase class IV
MKATKRRLPKRIRNSSRIGTIVWKNSAAKTKRKRSEIRKDGDLDDEDMDLLNENLGLKKETRYKKLRKKGDQRREDEADTQTSNAQPSLGLENLLTMMTWPC